MENTSENKERFIAQYYGQKILYITPLEKVKVGFEGWSFRHPSHYIELTPLSEITDEDALAAMRIIKVYQHKEGYYITEHAPIAKVKACFSDVPRWRLDVADYLRQRGYALPYLDASVEGLVSFGWVKLKEA